MEHKVLDFDLFMREKNRETITVKIYGEDYEIPMQTPAIVPVTMARAEMSPDPAQSTMMIMKAADAMLGAETVDKLCRHGMSAYDLSQLVQKLFHEFNMEEENEAQDMSDKDSRVVVGGKREKK